MLASFSTKKKLILDFWGPMVAAATPYKQDGTVNYQQIIPYAEHLADIGVKGLFILGTTGESLALTLDEKLKLIEAWSQALNKLDSQHRFTAIVNVTALSFNDVVDMAKQVEKLGRFNGMALMQPMAYKASNEHQMVKYINKVFEASGANLPLLYYHFPNLTGPANFDLKSFIAEALKNVPQFCAIKYTDVDIVNLGQIQRKFGNQIKIFTGYDEALLAAKSSFNINAGICATFSSAVCTKAYLEMLQNVDQGNIQQARKNQDEIAEVCGKLQASGNFFASLKEMLNRDLASKSINLGSARIPVLID